MSTITHPQPPTFFEQWECQTEEKTVCSVEQELYSPHFLAQDLNNEASALLCKERDIPRAIKLLVRALELSRWSPPDEDDSSSDDAPCACEHCSLDSCLFLEEGDDLNSDYQFYNFDGMHAYHRAGKRTRLQRDQQRKNQPDEKDGFVYRRPLRVSSTCMLENHYMGSTLTVMILFNLALAHQLLGMSIPSNWPQFEDRLQSMDKALKLYELCTHACPACNGSDAAGLRLKLLVMNNISQIHKLMGFPKKHRRCLEYLLRALMFISHGREGGWDHDFLVLTPLEMESIYRNIQSSSVLLGKEVHAAAA